MASEAAEEEQQASIVRILGTSEALVVSTFGLTIASRTAIQLQLCGGDAAYAVQLGGYLDSIATNRHCSRGTGVRAGRMVGPRVTFTGVCGSATNRMGTGVGWGIGCGIVAQNEI